MYKDQPMQDRGTKKWTTMMLPEHKEQLKEMWEQKRNQKRPDFDEQQLQEFSEIIVHAYSERIPVLIVYCRTKIYHEENVYELIGIISGINSRLKTITIQNKCIYVEDLLDIQFADGSL